MVAAAAVVAVVMVTAMVPTETTTTTIGSMVDQVLQSVMKKHVNLPKDTV